MFSLCLSRLFRSHRYFVIDTKKKKRELQSLNGANYNHTNYVTDCFFFIDNYTRFKSLISDNTTRLFVFFDQLNFNNSTNLNSLDSTE